uniref:Uncharacterized protein n=1 Tax=Leersia perrieri TaxID=77586 RepID=A0A0D9VKM1_9ORYZ
MERARRCCRCSGGADHWVPRDERRAARRGGGKVHRRRQRRMEVLRRGLGQGEDLPRRRRARVQVQRGGARRGGRGPGGVPELHGAEGRQEDAERARQGDAPQGHALLHLHRAGALQGRHEACHQGHLACVVFELTSHFGRFELVRPVRLLVNLLSTRSWSLQLAMCVCDVLVSTFYGQFAGVCPR